MFRVLLAGFEVQSTGLSDLAREDEGVAEEGEGRAEERQLLLQRLILPRRHLRPP